MSRQFTHLHVHTEYSLLDGFSPITKLLDYAEELNMKSLAITDHGSMFGVVQFYKEAKKRNIKPIIGCEIYTVNGSYLEKTSSNKRYNHLVLLAENEIGYKNLMEIVSLGYVNGFYYKPRVDKEVLRQYSEGIIALSACLAGEVSQQLIYDDYENAKKAALELENIFGKGNFYLEIQNHGINEDKIILDKMPLLSKETGIPMVATNDIHYVKKDDWRIHDILLCIQLGKTIQEKNEGGMHYAPGEFYLRSADEMYEILGDYEEALENTNKIAERCNVKLDFGHLHLPYFEIPEGYNNKTYLRELANKGIEKRYEKITDVVLDRLEFELNTIEEMGFVDYFLIVSDFIRFAKTVNIPVGPGRGSAAGSIVSYALEITDIDPLKYNLLFERFLNPERVSMPDIDIDFCYERREEVIDYVVEKYGEEKVAQIVTFGTMAARGSIRDVGRVLDMEYNLVDEVAKKVPMMLNMTIDKALEMSPEFRQLYNSDENIKNLIDIANEVEGMPRHTSTHAAGVVISEKPIVEYVPLAKNKESIITQFNMIELEELGLLKMDFLGLRTLTVIQDAIDLVNSNSDNEKIAIKDMDENDPEVLSMFTVADTLGIFQFESAGMRAFLKDLKPTKFNDLIAANSLFRPGPMKEIPTYINNKNNVSEIEYLHPLLEPILNVTYGTIVYQEQVMQIVQQLAGYSLGGADNLRRAMSKKKMDVMEAERKKFIFGEVDENDNIIIKGVVRNGVSEEVGNKIYDLMIDFAKYAFNKSHSAAYSLVAMRTAWLKHYYPVEFMAALLSSIMGNTSQVALYIQECKRLKIEILQPDVNYSLKKFNVENGKIRFGLLAIKNVGEGLIDTIVKIRNENGEFKNFREFIERIIEENQTVINKRAIECLIKAGAFSSMGVTRAGLMVEYSLVIDSVQSSQKKNIPGQASLFDLFEEEEEEEIEYNYYREEYDKKDLLKFEKDVLGIYLTDHPMRPYENLIEYYSNFSTLDLEGDATIVEENWDKKFVTIVGIVDNINKKFTKNNKIMEFVRFEDLYGAVELTVFPNMYEKYKNILEEDKVLLIKGTLNISERDGANIIVSSIIDANKLNLDDKSDCKKLFLRLKNDKDSDLIRQIQNALYKYKGKDTVNLFFEESKKGFKLNNYSVDVTNCNLIQELENIIGKVNVKIV